jgi:hypothetical protein
MANNAESGTVEGVASSGSPDAAGYQVAATSTGPVSQLGPFPPFHGRTVSWVAVSIVMVGFLVGGVGLMFGSAGPTWWLFWTGVGVSVLGLLLAAAANIFEDWY